ncbi:DDE-1 domain-containing protein [Trichonephila clavipes]|uniref:DDE-1 domain-containing protein n=1 Tax=Trichonephila clavipes TaxID=2585209 RepID=A0A8X6T1W2_TRICX|nr:DDE-1 domain-containing protein [Trichonephila clavipes]
MGRYNRTFFQHFVDMIVNYILFDPIIPIGHGYHLWLVTHSVFLIRNMGKPHVGCQCNGCPVSSISVILCCREQNIILVGLPPHTSHRFQTLDVFLFGQLKTIVKHVTTLWSLIQNKLPDKNIGELLSTAYFKSATVENAVKGFKECGIKPHNPLQFSEHDFAVAKTADHDVVADATKINSANPPTLVVEYQHINLPEEPEFMANTDSDARRSMLVFFFISSHCQKRHDVRKKEKAKKVSSCILTSTPIKEMLEQREKKKEEQETLRYQRREAHVWV